MPDQTEWTVGPFDRAGLWRIEPTGPETTPPDQTASSEKSESEPTRLADVRGFAIACNLSESSFADMPLRDLGVDLGELVLQYHDHLGHPGLRQLLAREQKPEYPDTLFR